MHGFLAWAFASYLSAEIFSFFHIIGFYPALIFWLGLNLPITYKICTSVAPDIRGRIAGVPSAIVFCFAAVTLFIALTAAPNNWDSQTYHLPRIEHWIQNRSLEPYPTAINRQVGLPPLAEILLLHTRILSGSARYYLLIQWISMIVSFFAVFRIARQLGGSTQQSWIAGIFAITLPIGILESTSTQNDYVSAALLGCFVSFGIQEAKKEKPDTVAILVAVTAIALSGLVKPSSFLIGAGFAIWFTISIARKIPPAKLGLLIAGTVIVFTIVLGPYMLRNGIHSRAQSNIAANIANASMGISQTLIVLILNIASNLSTDVLPLNDAVYNATVHLCSFLGMKEYAAHIIFPGQTFSLPKELSLYHEDTAPNPIHTIFVIAAFVLFLLKFKKSISHTRLYYWMSWLFGAVAFAAVIRWQPWITRLQLPGFILVAPCVGLAWPRQWTSRLLAAPLLSIFVLGGLKPLFYNTSRPLLPISPDRPSYLTQESQKRLFANRPQLLVPYLAAVDELTRLNASQIGLLMAGDDWEYPFWSLLRDRHRLETVRIEHISRNNEPLTWPLGPFLPDAIVSTVPRSPSSIHLGGSVFSPSLRAGPVVIYKALDMKKNGHP